MNNSPTAAEGFSTDLGQGRSNPGGRGVNQPVKNWPKDNATSKSELDDILKRLAERVQYITGATGAAVGLLEGTDMVCRATSGTTAPDLGVQLERWKGLSGECIRSGESLRCDNVEMDHRVEVESCRRMGVQSIIVTPVRRNNVIVGIFELFSSQPYAFQERDVATLQRTAELVKKELETRPLVVDAAYVRLPERGYAGVESANHKDRVEDMQPPALSEITAAQRDNSPTAIEESFESASLTPCRNCGAAMPADRLLCSACGSLQADPDSMTITFPEVEPPKFFERSGEEDQRKSKYRIRLPRYSLGAILAMMALFVAFIPIRTNQPANAQAASNAPAPQQSLPQLPMPSENSAGTATTQPAAASSPTQDSLPSNAGSSTTVAPPMTQAAPGAQQSAAPAPASSSPQVVQYAPVTGNPQMPATSQSLPMTQPQVGSTRVNQAGWQTTTTPASEPQTAEVVPQTIPIGPIAGTPHINPEAQAPPPMEAQPGQSSPAQGKQPWLIARISNAIDSFQQMFQAPPEPGPTAEQLGDPNVVVWVDLTTGLYYCPGASSYGKTEKGKFLTQKEAHAEYFNSAIRIGCK